MELFTPTLDWSSEVWTSLVWIAEAWAIAAVCTVVVLVLLGLLTTWGRQFWRITGAYFTGPGSVKVWLWLGALLLSVVAASGWTCCSATRATTCCPASRSRFRASPSATPR
ncbi:hypothetical protein ACFQX6_08525 [Streptosporangium lutulentum]